MDSMGGSSQKGRSFDSSESKADFGKAMPLYGTGTFNLVRTGTAAASSAKSIAVPSPAILKQAGTLFFVAKNTPKAAKVFKDSTASLIKYGRKSGVDTKALEKEAESMGE